MKLQLLALCPCERVIIDKQGVHSLIEIIRNVSIEAALDAIPRNAVAPRPWSIYSMWKASSDEVGKKVEQVYQIYWPSGEKFSEENVEFVVDSTLQQVTLDLVGFPAGQSGDLRVVTWLFYAGHPVSEIIETSIHVAHAARQTSTSVPAPTQ